MSNDICNENCNKCHLMISNPQNRLLTYILNKAYDEFGDNLYKIVQDACPNLTCCNECHIDDFVHLEGCTIIEVIDND